MRRLIWPALAVMVAVGAFAAVGAGSGAAKQKRPAAAPSVKAQLQHVNHVVVIYEENHSFDNLYGGWEGVDGRGGASAAHTTQVDQAGQPLACLPQNDVNLTVPPLAPSCSPTSAFGNAPFQIDAPSLIPASATTCPKPLGAFAPNGFPNGTGLPGGCTRDIVHRFYQEQYQLDNGKMDRYTTGSDAVGLTQGYYDTKSLPIYRYLHQPGHPKYAIADRFFQAAFGGSFLNHQWLVAAATPVWANAPNDGGPNDLHAVVDANGMPNNYPLYSSPLGSQVRDSQLTASCSPPAGRPATPSFVACGDFAVNTSQPWYQPYSPGTADTRRIPPLTNPTIGDELSAKKIDWAWYGGGWSNADGDVGAPGWTNGSGPKCADANVNANATYPNCPDVNFQYHHQAFDYFQSFAPGTQARKDHLRDEQEFIGDATTSTSTCKLKAVSFIKPIGEENEHPGYTSEVQGSDHLVTLLKDIEGSACAKDTLVVVTYDEFGGQWDHVSPPGLAGTAGAHDKWGPGTRVPAIVLSPQLKGPFVVDHVQHDTTSILATIEHRFGLQPLGSRDGAVPDLASVFAARAAS